MAQTQITPQMISKLILDPINNGFAAALRDALKSGVPARDIIELTLNQMVSIVAMVEPKSVREALIMDVIGSINPLVVQHVEARMGTLILPTKEEESRILNGASANG